MKGFSAFFALALLLLLAAPSQADPATWAPPAAAEWTIAKNGKRTDLVNIYLHASKDRWLGEFKEAGWIPAAESNLGDALRYFFEITGREIGRGVLREKPEGGEYPVRTWMSASVQSYRGKSQVLAFQKGNETPAGRHHFRIFSTDSVDEDKVPVWAIAATEDIGLTIALSRPDLGFVNHVINENADIERDFVLRSLQELGGVVSVRKIPVETGGPWAE